MTLYMPILKWKQGEYTAFCNLAPGVIEQVTPLFEITPPDYDFENREYSKSIDDHLKTFAERYKKNCNGRKIFLDTHLVPIDMKMVNGKLPMEYLYYSLKGQKSEVIPVVHLNSSDDLLHCVALINLLDGHGACLRLLLSDLLDSDIQAKIDRLQKILALNVENMDLLIDLERPTKFDPVSDFTQMLCSVLSSIPYLDEWKTFAVAATSFPKSMTEVTAQTERWERKEWLAYNELMLKDELGRKPIFSDYGINGPGFEALDFRKMTRKCAVKYTVDNEWVILKGKKTSKEAGWMKEYHDLAHTIANADYFYGEDYSAGDKRIAECAAQKKDKDSKSPKKTEPGNPTTWVAIGVNHHMTKVVDDLSNMGAS